VLANPRLATLKGPKLIGVVTQLGKEANFVEIESPCHNVDFIMGAPFQDVRPVLPVSGCQVPIHIPGRH
jgi:hypothetical protein